MTENSLTLIILVLAQSGMQMEHGTTPCREPISNILHTEQKIEMKMK